jgi:predicted MFS family arabinose efflux permease
MTGLLAALAVTQILGWGTTFYIPAVLGEAARAATGLSREIIFGGVTTMYVVGGLASPRIGRLVDRLGARPLLVSGSALAALALAGLAFATQPLAWLLCWVAIGLMMPMALSNAAVAAIAQAATARGINPRRPIGVFTLATGLAISVAFPLGTLVAEQLGWRGACLLFAAVHLLVCLPLHLTVPRGAAPARASAAGLGRVPDQLAPRVMLLLAVTFTLHGFCSVALELHLLTLLQAAGMSTAGAVALAAVSGPLRVSARLLDMALARRVSALGMGLGALALLPPALLCLLAGGVAGSGAFVVLWSVSMGIGTVARAAVPLELFGPAGYATRLGRLTLPVNLGQAVGPVAFAFLIERAGVPAVGWLTLAIACGAVAALAAAAITVRRVG